MTFYLLFLLAMFVGFGMGLFIGYVLWGADR